MLRILKKLLIILICAALPLIIYSDVNNSPSSVSVIAKYKEAFKMQPDKTDWQSLDIGNVLGVNYSVRTGVDSYAELNLSPGNSVRIKERSEILIKNIEKESKESNGSVVKLTDFALIDGDLALKLDKLPKDTLIQVSSPTAIAGARGTAFVVGYNSSFGHSNVGVLESSVVVQSVSEPGKAVTVPTYNQVQITPWAMAVAQVKGSGILSKTILGEDIIEKSNTPVLIEKGTGSTEDAAKDNVYYNLSKKVLAIPVSADKRIEDLLNDNPALCQPLYSYIVKAEILSQKTIDGKIEITAKLPLAPVSDIVKYPLPPMPSVVEPVTLAKYGEIFGAKARVTTTRAAQLDGYRKLAEAIYGTVITSDTTLEDMAVSNDVITTTVEGVVKGAEIIDTKYFSDGSVTVTMTIRADLARKEVSRITGDVFGLNYFTSPTVIDIDDFLALE